jgi:hypothetical protein
LSFILLLLHFDVDIEWLRFVPGSEAVACRSFIQAGTGRQIAHSKEKKRLKVIFIVCDYSCSLGLKLYEALFLACNL